MNILFDLVATQPERDLKFHGGSEYAKAVFWAIVPESRGRLYCIYDSGRYLDEDIKSYCTGNNIPLIDIMKNWELNSVIEKYTIDRFFTALPLDKIIQKSLPVSHPVKSIIVIHGLRSIELPFDEYELKYHTGFYNGLKYLYKRFMTVKYRDGLLSRIKRLIKNYHNPTIVTVSNSSRKALKNFIPEIPESNIHVFYSPIRDYVNVSNDDSFLLTSKLVSKKYFLLLSAGIWQKNGYRMLSAFNNLIKKDMVGGYKFVVVGATGGLKKTFRHNSFVFLDYLDRPELEVLLKHAHALVYPSLNEGFGYPPLEAFKYGTGVIASAIGPVMEVCGNAALFFNPYSPEEMRMKLLQSINDPEFITGIKSRTDQFLLISQRQKKDLDSLVHLIFN